MTRRKPPLDMRKHIKERTELALIYAEDGAYHSAARVLADLHTEVRRHANQVMDL